MSGDEIGLQANLATASDTPDDSKKDAALSMSSLAGNVSTNIRDPESKNLELGSNAETDQNITLPLKSDPNGGINLAITPTNGNKKLNSPLLTPVKSATLNFSLSGALEEGKLKKRATLSSHGGSPHARKVRKTVTVNIPNIPEDGVTLSLTEEESKEISWDIDNFIKLEYEYFHSWITFIEPFDYEVNLIPSPPMEDIIIKIPDAAHWDDYLEELKELKLAELRQPGPKSQAHRRRESWIFNAIPADPRVVTQRLQKYLNGQAGLFEGLMSPVSNHTPKSELSTLFSADEEDESSQRQLPSVNPNAAPFIPRRKRSAPEHQPPTIPKHESDISTNPEEDDITSNPNLDANIPISERPKIDPKARLNAKAAEFTPTLSSSFRFTVHRPGGNEPYRLALETSDDQLLDHRGSYHDVIDNEDRPYGELDRLKRHRLKEYESEEYAQYMPGHDALSLSQEDPKPEYPQINEEEKIIRPGRDSMSTFKFPAPPSKAIEIKKPLTPPPSMEKTKPSESVTIFGAKPLGINPQAPTFEFAVPSRITQRYIEDQGMGNSYGAERPHKRVANGFDEQNNVDFSTEGEDAFEEFHFPEPPKTISTRRASQYLTSQLRPASAPYGVKYFSNHRSSLGSIFGTTDRFSERVTLGQHITRTTDHTMDHPSSGGGMTLGEVSAASDFVYPEVGNDNKEIDYEHDDNEVAVVDLEANFTISKLSHQIAGRVQQQVAEQVQDVLDVLVSGYREKEDQIRRDHDLQWTLLDRKYSEVLERIEEKPTAEDASFDQEILISRLKDEMRPLLDQCELTVKDVQSHLSRNNNHIDYEDLASRMAGIILPTICQIMDEKLRRAAELESVMKTTEDRADSLAKDNEFLRIQLGDMARQMSKQIEEFANLREASKKTDSLAQQVEQLKYENGSLQKRLNDMVDDETACEQEMKRLREEANRAESLGHHVKQLKEDLVSARNRSVEMDAITFKLNQQIQKQLEDMEAIHVQQVEHLKDENQSLQNRVNELLSDEHERKEEINRLRDAAHKVETLENVVEQLKEDLGHTRNESQVLQERLNEDLGRARNENQVLQKRLNDMVDDVKVRNQEMNGLIEAAHRAESLGDLVEQLKEELVHARHRTAEMEQIQAQLNQQIQKQLEEMEGIRGDVNGKTRDISVYGGQGFEEIKQPSAQYGGGIWGWPQFYDINSNGGGGYDLVETDGMRTPTLSQQNQTPLWSSTSSNTRASTPPKSMHAHVMPSPAPTPTPRPVRRLTGIVDDDDGEGEWWTAD